MVMADWRRSRSTLEHSMTARMCQRPLYHNHMRPRLIDITPSGLLRRLSTQTEMKLDSSTTEEDSLLGERTLTLERGHTRTIPTETLAAGRTPKSMLSICT